MRRLRAVIDDVCEQGLTETKPCVDRRRVGRDVEHTTSPDQPFDFRQIFRNCVVNSAHHIGVHR